MSYIISTWSILLGVLMVTSGCFPSLGDKSGEDNKGDVADIQAFLSDSPIEDSTPLSQIVARSKCANEGKSCLRWRDAKLLCSVDKDAQGVPDFNTNTIFSVTRTLLTLYRSKIDIDERILWPDHHLTVGDITKLSPRLYLMCFASMFALPGKRDGVARKALDEPLFFKDRIDLNKEVLTKGACYMPMWNIVVGESASEILVGRCNEIEDDKYKKRKNRIEITFHKLKS